MYRKLFSILLVGCFVSVFLLPLRDCAAGKHHHGHARSERRDMHRQPAEDLGACPVMGGAAKKEYSYTHDGKTYYFCCPWSMEEFKKNPKTYISDKQ